MSTRLYVAAIHGSNEQGGIVAAVLQRSNSLRTTIQIIYFTFAFLEEKRRNICVGSHRFGSLPASVQ